MARSKQVAAVLHAVMDTLDEDDDYRRLFNVRARAHVEYHYALHYSTT